MSEKQQSKKIHLKFILTSLKTVFYEYFCVVI
jgi:hypothetical protein